MSWGTRIAALYIGFVIMISVLVFKSNGEKVDLVSVDYYAQELKFQDKIDGQKNMNSLSGRVTCEAKNKSVTIQFPAELIGKYVTGEILFYRPSDNDLDLRTQLLLDSLGKQKIRNDKFKRGVYLMQIKCSLNSKSFYYEQQIFMN